MEKIEIRKFLCPEVLTGTDARMLAGNYFKGMNIRNILIVTDEIIVKQFWFVDILNALRSQQIEYAIYDKTSINSPDNQVMQGLEYYHEHKCIGLLAVGGGSVIDCAKAIGIVYSNHRHISNFEGVDKIKIPSPPLICIPTTAGSASDVSQFAIIRDMSRLVKIAIVSKSLIPDVSLIDPVVCSTLSGHLTACTGMDALTHAIEAFVSTGHSSISDMHALQAIKMIKQNMVETCKNPQNQHLRFDMMLGCFHAGLAFSNASLGAVHALAHSIGGFYDSNHGETNALLLEHIIRFNYPLSPDRYNVIAQLFDEKIDRINESERCERLIQRIIDLKMNIGLNYSLQKLGVKSSDFHLLANNASLDACMLTNPRKAGADDLKAVLTNAI